MAKQPATNQNTADYFPGIKSVSVPEAVKRVMSQQKIDPQAWEDDLNRRIQLGGTEKEEALSRAFPLFDQIENTSRFSSILSDGFKAKASREKEVQERRQAREARLSEEPPAAAAAEVAPAAATPKPAEKPAPKMNASLLMMSQVYNSITKLAEGPMRGFLDFNRALELRAGDLPWADENMKARQRNAETRYKQGVEDIRDMFEGVRAKVEEQDQKMPFSFRTSKDGKFETDFTEVANPRLWASATGQAVGSLISILAPTKKASFLMSFAQMYSDNQDEAIAAGLKGDTAALYTTGVTMVGSALEMLGDVGILKALKGTAGKEVIKKVVKDEGQKVISDLAAKGITKEIFDDVVTTTFKRSMQELADAGKSTQLKKLFNFGKKVVNGAAPEMGTEFAQEWSTYAGKTLSNSIAGSDVKEGEGRFETDAYKTLGDASFGALMGGVLGGAIGSFAKSPKDLHETMGAFINADIKEQLAKNPNATLEDIVGNSRFNSVRDAARGNGQFNDENGNYSPDIEESIKNKADLIYKTYFEFKDLPAFTAEDKLAMFNVTDQRNQNLQAKNQADQMVSQVKEIQGQIDDLVSSGGDPLAVTKLQATKSVMEKNLGALDPATGEYELTSNIKAKTARMENIFRQAMPAITGEDPRMKALGRSFLNSNIDSFRDPGFEPQAELRLSNGTVILRDNETTAIRKLQSTPIAPQQSMLDQVAKGEYNPLPRYQKTFVPVDSFAEYTEAADRIQAVSAKRTDRETLSEYSYPEDAADLINSVTAQVQGAAKNMSPYPQVEQLVDSAYDIYSQIVTEDARTKNQTVLPLTYPEFYAAVGFQSQGEIDFTTAPDPKEKDILSAQQKSEIPTEADDLYVASLPSMKTVMNIEKGAADIPMPDVQSAATELIGLRNYWQNMFKSPRREYTYSQINDVIEAIDADLATLAEEVGFQENPETRPDPALREEQNDEGTEGENIDGEGNGGGVEQPRSVQSEYASTAAVEEVLEPAASAEQELSNQLGSLDEAIEAAIASGEEADVARVIEELDRAVERVGKSSDATSGLSSAVDAIVSEDSGDSSGVESDPSATEGVETSPDGNEIPVLKTQNSRKGKRKDQRRIIKQERIDALAKFPANPLEEVYQYFIGNGQIKTSEVNAIFLKKKRGEYQAGDKTANEERKAMISNTAGYGLTINQLAHQLYEKTNFPDVSDVDFRDMVEGVIRTYPGIDELTSRVNKQEVQVPDSDTFEDYEPSDAQPEGIDNTFAENLAKTKADPNYTPFSDGTTNANDKEVEFILYNGKRHKFNTSDIQIEPAENFNLSPKSWSTVNIMAKGEKLGAIDVTKTENGDVKISLSRLNGFNEEAYIKILKDLNLTSQLDEYLAQKRKVENNLITKLATWLGKLKSALSSEVVVSEKPEKTGQNINNGKGIGSVAYELLAKKLKSEYGMDLVSDTIRSDAAENLWQSFARNGKAEIIGNPSGKRREYYFKFLPDAQPKSANTQTQKVLTQLASAIPGINTKIAANQNEYISNLNSVPGTQQLFTKDNVPYGFISPVDGSINLDPSRLNLNTAIHEYGHVWLYDARINNPELHRRGQDLVKDTVYYRKIKANPLYNTMSEDRLLDEALATAIGDKGAAFITDSKKSAFREFMSKLFAGVKKLLGIKGKSPAQIADMNFEDFTQKVVEDLMSGDQISNLTSEQVASIIQAGTPDAEINSQEPVTADPLFHHAPTVFGVAPGESVGTALELQDKVRQELKSLKLFDKLEKNLTTESRVGDTTTSKITERGLNDKDRKVIRELARQHGWLWLGAEMETRKDPVTGKTTKFRNNERWSRDISKEPNSFFLRGNKMAIIQLRGMTGKMGRIASSLMESEKWLEGMRETGNPLYKTANWLVNSAFDRLTNLETLVKAIDNNEGIFHTLIHDVKREAADNRNYALNIMGRAYEDIRRGMGKYSTHRGSSTLDTVVKYATKIIQWDRNLGKGVERSVSIPVSAVMDIVAKHMSQLSMGNEYNIRKVKDRLGVERIENHTTAVIDDHYNVDPSDTSIYWKKTNGVEDVHKGVHFKKDIAMEANADGELEPLKDGLQYGLFTQAEMDNMVDYVTTSGPREVIEAFAKIKAAFNNPTIQEMLRKENDEAVNPDSPFKMVPDYAPLQVVSKMSTQDRVNSFSPNLEDARQLNERTERSDALYAGDILDTYDFYSDSVGHILGSTKLVHNLKNIQQAVQSDFDGAIKKRLDELLESTIKNLQNFRQTQYAISANEKAVRPMQILMSKYTATIFRSNIGISTKQIGTWFSAYGLGYIDNKYLFRNKATLINMMKMAIGGSTIDRLAGGSVIEATGKGTRVFGAFDTQEAGLIRELTGESITDPILKEQHLRNWATVIQRTIYGQSQYTEAQSVGELRFSSAGRKKVKQLWNHADSMFEEYGMANIRRLDRAVILGYMVAAKQQVAAEIKSGKTKPEDADARAANLTTETLYLTNQMNDPGDLTMLQRNPGFAQRIVAMYSGQTQKLWNQMAGSTLEYYKNKGKVSKEVEKMLFERMRGSLVSNLVYNTMWMAGANMGASILRGWLAGEEDKEPGYYKEKFLWDTIRYMTGLAPGILTQLTQMVVSNLDNEKWTDEMFDIPGADVANNAWDFSKDMYGLTSTLWNDKSQEEVDKLISGAIFNFGRIFGVTTGAPKTWIDPVVKRINGEIKPPKGLKTSDIQLDTDTDFEFDMGGDLEDDFEFDYE